MEKAAYADLETALKAGLSAVGVDRRGLAAEVARDLETARGRARVKERRGNIMSEISERWAIERIQMFKWCWEVDGKGMEP